MKSRLKLLAVSLLLSTINYPLSTALAQGTAFSYQGRLDNSGSPANGLYDFQFSLSNAPSGGSQVGTTVTNLAVGVTNGLFTTGLDFGAVFSGNATWLAIGVRTNGVGSYVGLDPLQPLTPTPYAIYSAQAGSAVTATTAASAGSVSAANLVGTIQVTALPPSVLTNGASGVNLNGTFSGNGSGVTNVSYSSLNLNWGNFVLTSTLTVGGVPEEYVSVCAADVNEDGYVDLISANYAADTLTVWTNNGSGAFGSNATLSVGGGPVSVITADVNGDGHLDLICFSRLVSACTLTIFTNNGLGLFGFNATLPAPLSAQAVIAADVNGDGYLDLISADGSAAALDVWTNNGSGVFGYYTNLPTDYDNTLAHQGGYPISVCAADVNGDGYVDLISANTGLGNGNGLLEVWTNNGSGVFSYNAAYGVGQYNDDHPFTVIATDVNGDGHVDLICEDGTNSLTVFTNNGLGGFAYNATLRVGQNFYYAPNSVTAADVNGDGHVDLISANGSPGTLTVLTNNGNGVFGYHATLAGGGGPASVIVADVNQDGHVDLVEASQSGLCILLNTPAFSGVFNGVFSGTYLGSGFVIQQNTNGAPNLIGGSLVNNVSSGVVGAAIGGGGASNYDGSSDTNSVTGDFGVVGGGQGNTAGQIAAVGGGSDNTAGGSGTTVGGGFGNTASNPYSTVGGGYDNYAFGAYATVAGGESNGATNGFSFVGGGLLNVAGGQESVVCGGYANHASGAGAFVGGGGYDGTTYSGNAASGDISGVAAGSGNLASGYASLIGGGTSNVVSGPFAVVAGGIGNLASGTAATVGGGGTTLGKANAATGDYSTVAGGYQNTASGAYATVSGGGSTAGIYGNVASGTAATVGGGFNNTASGAYSIVAGGGGPYLGELSFYGNTAAGASSVVSGGSDNEATGQYATIPGGSGNYAGGAYSFAAGQNAQALHPGAFVWADSQSGAFDSTGTNQFLIRAGGNVGINTASPESDLSVVRANPGSRGAEFSLVNPAANAVGNEVAINFGTDPTSYNGDSGNAQIKARSMNTDNRTDLIFSTYNGSAFGERMRIQASGNVGIGNSTPGYLLVVGSSGSPAYCNGTTWVNGSDRNSKQDFSLVNPRTVLEKVSALPITEWRYKVDTQGEKHLGPMAQDFYAAFGLNGVDDKHISTVDEGGVALAAIQGLNDKVEAGSQRSEHRIQKLEAENVELKARLEKLEQLMNGKIEGAK